MKSEIENSLGFLLHSAARQLRRAFELRTHQSGLSSAQWRVLAHLIHKGALNQARLAELLEIEPISVSRLLNRMEDSGWIVRKPDLQDRRIRVAHPTEKSLQAFQEIRGVAQTLYDDALNGLSAEQRTLLISALQIMIENLALETQQTDDSAQAH